MKNKSLLIILGAVLLPALLWDCSGQQSPAANEEMILLTPKPGPAPKINGPRIFGVKPGHPFIYRIPCTGERPISFHVDNLPQGLSVDAARGIITGRAPQNRGDVVLSLHAENGHGEAKKEFTLRVGDQLALTPPMGWNSWYIHYHRVTDDVMRHAADAMVSSGMADYGYMYVNIDDCWMRIEEKDYDRVKKRFGDFNMSGVVSDRLRDEAGHILPNANFPDMRAMTDYIHSLGLRAGIYTSPGPRTCQRYAGAYGHEAQDAQQFAQWGFDFLKYDWCSYGEIYKERMKKSGNDLAEKKYPYEVMRDALQNLDRDIVLNLCQYGMSEVWTWGAEVGQCWRTTGDLGLERGDKLPGFYRIGLSNAEHWQYAGPGAWNDPDYILIGWVGDAHGHGIGKKTALTAHEQYSYMSMWALMAAPLVFSGDMSKLDEFTLNVLCNAEVIDIDQDPLGKQARPLVKDKERLVLAKDMEDGSLAVGLFNLTEQEQEMQIDWKTLDLSGKQRVRDVWRQKDFGLFAKEFAVPVPRHGVALVRLWPQS